MKIPSRFTLLGTTYRVMVTDAKDWKEVDAVAYVLPQSAEIHIKRGEPQVMLHSFWHEAAHLILHAMGEDRLYRNEKFVDVLGGMIHQILTSAK